MKASKMCCPKIAVGFGRCHDVIVRATDFFEAFGFEHGVEQITQNSYIETRKEFEEMFLFYFSRGAAAE